MRIYNLLFAILSPHASNLYSQKTPIFNCNKASLLFAENRDINTKEIKPPKNTTKSPKLMIKQGQTDKIKITLPA